VQYKTITGFMAKGTGNIAAKLTPYVFIEKSELPG
jgi:hypothetical protein